MPRPRKPQADLLELDAGMQYRPPLKDGTVVIRGEYRDREGQRQQVELSRFNGSTGRDNAAALVQARTRYRRLLEEHRPATSRADSPTLESLLWEWAKLRDAGHKTTHYADMVPGLARVFVEGRPFGEYQVLEFQDVKTLGRFLEQTSAAIKELPDASGWTKRKRGQNLKRFVAWLDRRELIPQSRRPWEEFISLAPTPDENVTQTPEPEEMGAALQQMPRWLQRIPSADDASGRAEARRSLHPAGRRC